MRKKINPPKTSALAATSTDVTPGARCRRRAAALPGSNDGEMAPSELRRISRPTKLDTARSKKTARATRNVVSTVRMAEASIAAKASSARKMQSRTVLDEYRRTSDAKISK